MKVLLILLLPFVLNAAKILSYNVYDRTDRVDVMITFDTPYNGRIKQSKTKSKIIIKLENASIESSKSKKVGSKFLQKLTIIPLKNETQLIATIPSSNIALIASKTVDAYGLRLRFIKKSAADQKNANALESKSENTDSLAALPTKKESGISTRYYIVITIMLIGIFILLYLKRKVDPKKQVPKKDTWLFKENKPNAVESTKTKNEQQNVSIRFQKAINEDNSVVMLDFLNQSYLVLMGKSNILLDKFTDNKPSSQQEFESILQNRHEELEAFLSTNNQETKTEKQEPLQAYKERAASLLYSDN